MHARLSQQPSSGDDQRIVHLQHIANTMHIDPPLSYSNTLHALAGCRLSAQECTTTVDCLKVSCFGVPFAVVLQCCKALLVINSRLTADDAIGYIYRKLRNVGLFQEIVDPL